MNPELNWRGFIHWLDGLLFRHNPGANVWQWQWTHTRNSEQLEEDYARMESAYQSQFGQVVADLRMKNELIWEGLSPQVSVLLGVRLEVVASFSHQCLVSSLKSPNMIRFPDVASYSELLAWFLTEWWPDHGVEEACRSWIANQWEQEAPEEKK